MASSSSSSSSIIFLTLLLCLCLFTIANATCPSPHATTTPSPLHIRYPFHLKGLKPKPNHEAHPAFELLRSNNATTTYIHFPSYDGVLVVKSISYEAKRIYLLDPKNCVHRVFLNLDLSLTPFRYYHVLKNYTYLNCSNPLPPPFTEIPCLSASGSHVYTVDPAALHVPPGSSCEGFRTAAIPFEYSPYLSGNSLGLELDWDLPQSQETQDSHAPSYTVIGFSICFLLVAIAIISAKRGHGSYRRSCCEKEGRLLQQSLPYV